MFWHKLVFRFKERYFSCLIQPIRRMYWRWQGMLIGSGVSLPPIYVTWPHQVQLGNNCKLERGVFFKFDGIWQPGPSILICERSFVGGHVEFNIRRKISIGADCLIASGCKFINHDHRYSRRDIPMCIQSDCAEMPIVLEDNVWLGVNVVVLKGAKIGRGTIVAAGSVVTHSIPSFEIWGGIPARKLSERPA